MAPKETRQYVVRSSPQATTSRDFSSLVLETIPLPPIGENEVLMRIHAVSLNWRDIMVASNTYLWDIKDGTVPCSDGAGEVVSIGSKVTRFKPGDRVAATFTQTWYGGPLKKAHWETQLGALMDGMLREYAVFNENGLVSIPKHLSYEEASTLPCAGVTAWSALMGGARKMQAGDVIVTQGTGGVSVFAAQFGSAAGAQVISTTSSARKADVLRKLGADHVINYNDTPEWGPEVKKLTADGEGADIVVEIGGPETVQQSLQALRFEGSLAVVGQRSAQNPNKKSVKNMMLTDAFKYICNTRRITVGSRDQFEEMNRSIAVNGIKPVVDEKIFSFADAREAFKYLDEQKHVGNVVIRIE